MKRGYLLQAVSLLIILSLLSAGCGDNQSPGEMMAQRVSVLRGSDKENPYVNREGEGRDWTTVRPPSPFGGNVSGRVFITIPEKTVDVPGGAVVLRAAPWGDFNLQVMIENLTEDGTGRAGLTIMRSPGSHLDFLFFLRDGKPMVTIEKVEGLLREELVSREVSALPFFLRLEYHDGRVTPSYRSALAGKFQMMEPFYYKRSLMNQGQAGLIAYGAEGNEFVFNQFTLVEPTE